MEYTYQMTCTRAVNKPKVLREVSSECYGNVLIVRLSLMRKTIIISWIVLMCVGEFFDGNVLWL